MKNFISFILIVVILISCKNESNEEAIRSELIASLNQELAPLSENPDNWKDKDLTFLDLTAQASVVALGEATHGTSEFFRAKSRIFKYLVDNHGFKTFAFEADFGESILINEAIQSGNCQKLEELMIEKMHFWTWNTEEVKDLLTWMCKYNREQTEDKKLQYVGIDCQYNTYHPDMLQSYLKAADVPFLLYAEDILLQSEAATEDNFTTYSSTDFEEYLDELSALEDSISLYEDLLISRSSQYDYDLHMRILRVIWQVSEMRFHSQRSSFNYRDKYMAENIIWYSDFLDEKIAVWAHNGHIANNNSYGRGGSFGYHLSRDLGSNYYKLGFLFSKGSFTAVGQVGESLTYLKTHSIEETPHPNSINFLMHNASSSVFSINMADLMIYPEWNSAFRKNLLYFQMGSIYNQSANYYSTFDSKYFDQLIYFDVTTASVLLD